MLSSTDIASFPIEQQLAYYKRETAALFNERNWFEKQYMALRQDHDRAIATHAETITLLEAEVIAASQREETFKIEAEQANLAAELLFDRFKEMYDVLDPTAELVGYEIQQNTVPGKPVLPSATSEEEAMNSAGASSKWLHPDLSYVSAKLADYVDTQASKSTYDLVFHFRERDASDKDIKSEAAGNDYE